mmetsp:Transcript_25254/g.38165  ORF Transcript_25254/g.38165 Transcript_25254/m.38165 type:complete len:183 (+) Transcript_25254:356-904(+)
MCYRDIENAVLDLASSGDLAVRQDGYRHVVFVVARSPAPAIFCAERAIVQRFWCILIVLVSQDTIDGSLIVIAIALYVLLQFSRQSLKVFAAAKIHKPHANRDLGDLRALSGKSSSRCHYMGLYMLLRAKQRLGIFQPQRIHVREQHIELGIGGDNPTEQLHSCSPQLTGQFPRDLTGQADR